MQEQMNLKINQEDFSILSLAEELKKETLDQLHLVMIFLSNSFLSKKLKNLILFEDFPLESDFFEFSLDILHKNDIFLREKIKISKNGKKSKRFDSTIYPALQAWRRKEKDDS